MNTGLPRRIKQHFDYIEARQYALANNKRLRDLTYKEMQMFKKQAASIKLNDKKFK